MPEPQRINVMNYRGGRNTHFSDGERVLVRDYRNPNTPSWSKAIIKEWFRPGS